MKQIRLAWAAALSLQAACGSPEPEEETPPRYVGGILAAEESYRVPSADAWKATEGALEEAECRVERRRRDDCGGRIVAKREDGRRVLVMIHSAERTVTEIAIYVEPADRDLIELVRTRIGEKLSLKKARTDLLGETSVETSYEVDLETAVAAAERTCRTLAFEITFKQHEEGRARIEARDAKERLVRFALGSDGAPGEGTEVVLTTEATPDGGDKEFLRRVRRELERHLFPSSD